jgi:hypothetical protein
MQARMKSVGRAARIVCGGHLPFILSCIAVLALSNTGWPQQDVNLPVTTEVPTAIRPAQNPVIAEIIGNDVYIRSGPGTHFYHCGKLFDGDRVQVVETQQGWSSIVPPPGCFSWVAMQYVGINLDNPTMGIITGNNVGVYAGSDYVEPMYSVRKQITLNRSQNVRLLSEEKDEYYKIAPPEGAYLWISSQFVRPVQPAGQTTPVEIRDPAATTPPPAEAASETPRTESELLDAYYALSKLVNDEAKKPKAEQDYAEITEKLTELAENEAGGRAKRYAGFTLKHVDRLELACTVAREMKLQSKELKSVTSQIDEARDARLAQISDLGKFAVIGKLEGSSLYASTGTAMAKRYRILDESGKTICYVSPTGTAAAKDYTKLIGHKVGLVGKIKPHQATGRAFVEFSELVDLDQ